MPITLRVHHAEKRSPAQYETISVGADVQAEGLEIHSADDMHHKLRELQAVARHVVEQQLHELMPSGRRSAPQSSNRERRNSNGNGNGHDDQSWNNGSNGQSGNGHQGRRRNYGRPDPEPTPKQRILLKRLADQRKLGPESIREICERIVGKQLEHCDRKDISRLIEGLIHGEEAA